MCIYCVTSINSGFTWNFSTLREAIAFFLFWNGREPAFDGDEVEYFRISRRVV